MYRIFLSVFLILFCAPLWGQNSLIYTLKPGDHFVIQQDAKQLITQQLEGITHEIENKISGLMEFKVTGVQDDQYELDMSFLDLGMQMSSNIQGEIMNIKASEIVEGDVQSQIFNSLLDVPIHIVLARNGNILAVEGGDSLIAKMTEASGLKDSISQNALKQSLKGEFGSKALSDSFKQMTYIYPEKENQSSTTWENEYSGKLSAKNSWTLEKHTDSLNHIRGKAQISMNISEQGTTMSLNGEQETTIMADTETGFIRDMLVEGFSEGTAMTELTGDSEIPTTIRSTTTYKLIRE